MIVFPGENIKLRTTLTSSEAVDRLREFTKLKDRESFTVEKGQHSEWYRGDLNGLTFVVGRRAGVVTLLLPKVKGSIIPGADKTTIIIKMRPSVLAILFAVLWLWGMGLSSVGVIFAMIFTGHFHFAGLKLFGFFLLGSALFFLSFSSEYHRVQSDMIQIFKAEVIIE